MPSFFDTDSDLALGGSLTLGGKPVIPHSDGVIDVGADVLAIPVTHRVVRKTTGGAESLTLADGTPGQKLTIILVSDGGDGTLTPATKTGWATCVFADVKDTLNLEYINDTIGWIVTGYSGTSAPPVLT